MLVRNKEDFQKLLRTPNDLQFGTFEAQFAQVQNTIIANYFGMDFVNALDVRYNANAPTPALHDDEIFVINQLKTAIVFLGFDLATPTLLANIRSTGIEQAGKSLFEWQQLILENNSLENGYNAIDAARSYLMQKRDNARFALWKNSTAEKNARKLLFNTTAEFHECVQIANSTRTFEALRQSVKEALVKHIEPITGYDLLKSITDKNIDYSITGTKQEALNLIREAVAQYAMSIAIYKLELKFNEQGARVVSVSSSSQKAKILSAADNETKDRIFEKFVSTGDMYNYRLKQFLISSGLYTEYNVTYTYDDIDNSKGAVVL